MTESLPVVYLLALLGILAIAGWFVVRQVLKTRTTELRLSNLRDKLAKEKGLAAEYYELGCIYLEKKLFVQAIDLLQKCLKAKDAEENDDLAMAYNALGYAYFCQEQYDLAIKQYKEALRINPEYVRAYNNLGHSYEKKKLTAQALEAYENVLKYDPKNDIAKRRADSMRKRTGITTV